MMIKFEIIIIMLIIIITFTIICNKVLSHYIISERYLTKLYTIYCSKIREENILLERCIWKINYIGCFLFTCAFSCMFNALCASFQLLLITGVLNAPIRSLPLERSYVLMYIKLQNPFIISNVINRVTDLQYFFCIYRSRSSFYKKAIPDLDSLW